MLNVKKRVDGIPIFDKFDRPLYHLNSSSEENTKKFIMVVDEINDTEGHYIKLNDCLKGSYEKIDIYTNSPLSINSYTIDDQSSIKSVLNWINKSVWNNSSKKKSKTKKFIKSQSKYNGQLNKEVPLIIKLFKSKNKNNESSILKCNLYLDENITIPTSEVKGTSENIENLKKSKKSYKSMELKKKQNKKSSSPKPSLLCVPIKTTRFSWLKRKDNNKFMDSNISVDEFQFQNTDINNYLPIESNNIFNHNYHMNNEIHYPSKQSTIINNNDPERKDILVKEEKILPDTIKIEINDEINENNNHSYNYNNNDNGNQQNTEMKPTKLNKNKQSLQSLVIPTLNSYETQINSARNLSASTLVNDQFDYPKYQEPSPYTPSPSYSSDSTLVSPEENHSTSTKMESKLEIDSCGYADYLNDKMNETQEPSEISDIERKHFSLPASTENLENIKNKRKGRKRSYAFSLTSNEFNLIYSKANQAVISELCQSVEEKQNENKNMNHPHQHHNFNHTLDYHHFNSDSTTNSNDDSNDDLNKSFSLSSKESETGKPFVKNHSRTQSRHRRSHAVCLSNEQIFSFENHENEDNSKQNNNINNNKRRSRYNKENSNNSLSTYALLNSNSKNNSGSTTGNTTKDTQLKRRSTNIIKYKNSNSSLSSSTSSNRNSYCSTTGSVRPVSTNRLSRDIEMLRAMKMKRSRSIPKLEQIELSSSSRNPIKSRYSMDVSSFSSYSYNDSVGFCHRSNSSMASNIIHYSFSNSGNASNIKNENNNSEGYKKPPRSSSYFVNTENINRWSSVFDNCSSGSSTYCFSEDESNHSNNNINNNMNDSLQTIHTNINDEFYGSNDNTSKSFNEILKEESSQRLVHFITPIPPVGIL